MPDRLIQITRYVRCELAAKILRAAATGLSYMRYRLWSGIVLLAGTTVSAAAARAESSRQGITLPLDISSKCLKESSPRLTTAFRRGWRSAARLSTAIRAGQSQRISCKREKSSPAAPGGVTWDMERASHRRYPRDHCADLHSQGGMEAGFLQPDTCPTHLLKSPTTADQAS